MAPQDDLLRNICQSEETFQKAQSVLRIAQQRTGPGSGFELGPLKAGLPAICAYIASSNLNNTDVTLNNAQVASCLKKSDFNWALNVVQNAMEDREDSPRKTRTKVDAYDVLLQRYQPQVNHQQFIQWMEALKQVLIESDKKFVDEVEKRDWKCTIFFWTFNEATGVPPNIQKHFAEEQKVASATLTRRLNHINTLCSSVKSRIQNDLKVTRSPTKASTTMTPRRSPKKPLRVLPSRDSPSKRKAAEPQTQLASDDDMDTFETPSKKRRADASPFKAALTKLVFPPTASSPRITLDEPRLPPIASRLEAVRDSMDFDKGADADAASPRVTFEDEMIEDEAPPLRRRFRPVYVDHNQWYAVDKRVKRLRRQTEQYLDSHGHTLRIQT
ncbi:hypothetical protein H0H92_016028 [Tricholoma furcatifolium]|nr:hypothetical protein H0H92_016028 [Tricholoma furcatifolium]